MEKHQTLKRRGNFNLLCFDIPNILGKQRENDLLGRLLNQTGEDATMYLPS
jgi:hypothetical protein